MSIQAFKSAVMPLLVELEASANAYDTDRQMAAYARESSLTCSALSRWLREGWRITFARESGDK